MSDKETAMVASKLSSNIEFEDAYKSKNFHQYFSYYFIAIIFIFICSISISSLYFSQQSKQAQAVINDQLAPLQTQFLQQVYLIKANKLIDELLQNFDAHHFITLQQSLSLQSKKLSLLSSAHHNSYQQWFVDNNVATDLLIRIESSHPRNKALKNKALIQLDTLLDAIEIQLGKHEVDSETAHLLLELQSNLSTIVTMLQRLNLQTSLGAFEQLTVHIDKMFVADYGKMLAKQQNDNQGMEEIVRDFIRFEDLVLKRGLLAKWQGQLRLMDGYRKQLVDEQQQLQSILDGLSESGESSDALMSTNVAGNKKILTQNNQPIWLWLSLLISLVSISALIWLIRLRIKTASRLGVKYITNALEGSEISLLNQEKNIPVSQQSKAFYCAESWQLLQKIKALNNSRYSEAEYLMLMKENQTLTEEVSKSETKKAQLTLELELVEFNVSARSKSKLLLEQQRCKDLYLAAIKQLVLLGSSAVATWVETKGNYKHEHENYIYHAYLQSRDLVRQLKQESCNRYLQSGDAILTLSDENITAQIQAVLLNLENEFSAAQNQVSLDIDENIQTAVNLDVELFTEMFRAFISQLLSQQLKQKLVLSLQLVDKNNGQQTINFSGQVEGIENLEQLPQRFERFNEVSGEKSGPTEYFTTLLQYQHGENISATLVEQGYQLSFTMPLAVTNSQPEQSHASITLPAPLPTIEQAITKLTTKYLTMPIEVLLAVKCPVQYQRLQQLLQAMGLQVSLVSGERMLAKSWESGRFAVLMTEVSCTSFTPFKVNEQGTMQENIGLPRGVFTLDSALSLETKEEFTHWSSGQLSANSSIDELITAMLPWIKEHESKTVATDKLTQVNSGSESENKSGEVSNAALASSTQAQSFDFERYIKNQGSPALALYMIDEYTSENSVIVERLVKAFYVNDVANIDIAIQALAVNSKILAADHLHHLCDHWQKLLSNQDLDNNQGIQISLLHKTKQAVEAINQHADAVA